LEERGKKRRWSGEEGKNLKSDWLFNAKGETDERRKRRMTKELETDWGIGGSIRWRKKERERTVGEDGNKGSSGILRASRGNGLPFGNSGEFGFEKKKRDILHKGRKKKRDQRRITRGSLRSTLRTHRSNTSRGSETKTGKSGHRLKGRGVAI